jgi:hypothetical protein
MRSERTLYLYVCEKNDLTRTARPPTHLTIASDTYEDPVLTNKPTLAGAMNI